MRTTLGQKLSTVCIPISIAICTSLCICCSAWLAPASVQTAQAAENTTSGAALIAAVNEGDREQVEALLAAGAPVNATDSQGLSALDHALAFAPAWAAPDFAGKLLQQGAKPGQGKVDPALALSRLLVSSAPASDIAAFLEKGFNLDERLPNGFTPFLWAATSGALPAYIDAFIAQGTTVNQALPPNELTGTEPGDEALILAAKYNPRPAIISALLRHGAQVNTLSTALNESPLLAACCQNPDPLAVAQVLLDAGADVSVANGVSYTAFICAAGREGASPLLELLVERGADVRDLSDGGGTAMHEAAMRNPDARVIRTLLALGTPINGLPAKEEAELSTDSVLRLALEYNPNPEVARILLASGVDTSRRNENGKLAWEDLPAERRTWLKKHGLDTLLVGAGAGTGATAAATSTSPQKSQPAQNLASPASASTAAMAIQDVTATLDVRSLPGVVGNLVKALRFNDIQGNNLVVLTQSEEQFRNKRGEPGSYLRDQEFFVHRFLINSDGSKVQMWRVKDFVYDCEYDLRLEFFTDALQVTDLDQDGLAEVWMPYRLGCPADPNPISMKIIMYEGAQKYAMRGETRSMVNPGQYAGGGYTMDKVFREGQAVFRDFATKLWAARVNE
ncbi:MAG: hypothetical protein GX087_05325 [Desulfobulbaceae bacterium]|nr:hypothetical protein [Desulfobulbaceae bacterium]